MASPKSFIKSLSIDKAKNSHNCKHSSKHRINRGEKRLGLKVERSTQYFCKDCAIKFLENGARDISKLLEVLRKN